MDKDYYKILGIGKTSSEEEIKKAYKKLALRYHPDKNSDVDAGERFRHIAEAYEVLSDREKRTEFDKYKEDSIRGRSRRSRRSHDENFARKTHFYPSDPFDLFKNFFCKQVNVDQISPKNIFPGFFFPHAPEQINTFGRILNEPNNLLFSKEYTSLNISEKHPSKTCRSSTTFKTGEDGTVHITRTVVGEDGRMRREMRFRTPSESREQEKDTQRERKSRRRPQSQQPPSSQQRSPSGLRTHSQRKGGTDESGSNGPDSIRRSTPTKPIWLHKNGLPSPPVKSKIPPKKRYEPQHFSPEPAECYPQRREGNSSKSRHQSLGRERDHRDRSCSTTRLEGSNSSLNSIHCALCDKEFPR